MKPTTTNPEKSTLSEIREGKTVTIDYIESGMGARGRLAELGIYQGERVKIVRNKKFGPILLTVKDSTIMLGRGMTRKIYVR